MKYSALLTMMLGIPGMALAGYSNYPAEFADFFHETQQQVTVTIAGERDVVVIPAIVNYDRFRLEPGSESQRYLAAYLHEKGLTNDAVTAILADSAKGITSDTECGNRLDKCVLSVEQGNLRYIFDFDTASLKLFVPPAGLITDSGQREYESAFNQHNALINWANLYTSSDLNGEDNFNMSNKTTLGLPLGHINLDTQYTLSDSRDDFDVYQAMYDVDFKGHKLQAGRSRYNLSFNSTDYLSAGARFSADSLFVGSSANLIKGKQAELQRLYFYAPQNGQLEVYRDDRLILNKVVNEGRQYISYAELPKGAYNVNIILKVSGQVVVNESRQVVNNNKFSLSVGQWDYVAGAGRLVNFYKNNDSESYIASPYFARGLLSYRLNEGLLLGGGAAFSAGEQYYQLGMNYFHGDMFGVDYAAGIFSNGAQYHYARLSSGAFYVDFRRFNQNIFAYTGNIEYGKTLASSLYGSANYRDIGVGVSGSIWGGSGFVSYHRYSGQSYNADADNSVSDNVRDYISVGWSTSLLGGNLSIASNYIVESHRDGEIRTDLTWSWALGGGYSSQVRLSADKNGITNNTNYLRTERQYGSWAANATAGAAIDQQNQVGADLSATLYGSTGQFNANAYGYINDSGEQRYSAGMSGAQIISGSGIDFSRQKAKSFVKLVKNAGAADDITPDVNYTVSRDGDYQHRGELKAETTLVRLTDYSQLSVAIDDAGHNVAIEGDKMQTFVHPGALYELKTQVIPLVSRIVVFDDVFGAPVTTVQCVGDGCVSVELLSDDGVFRINYRQQSPYQLVSRKGLCISESAPQQIHAKGYCLPGLDAQGVESAWQQTSELLDGEQKNNVLLYLGQFDLATVAATVTDRLTALDITYKDIVIDASVYIYIVNNTTFNSAQRQFLQELDAYVLLQDSEFDLLTTILMQGENDGV